MCAYYAHEPELGVRTSRIECGMITTWSKLEKDVEGGARSRPFLFSFLFEKQMEMEFS